MKSFHIEMHEQLLQKGIYGEGGKSLVLNQNQ
jgi:hypothetical protein